MHVTRYVGTTAERERERERENCTKYADRHQYWTYRQQRNAAIGWLVYAGKAELF
jgi:hypothetical protein